MLAVVDCRLGFCESVVGSRRTYLRAFDMNLQTLQLVRREELDLSVEHFRRRSD